MIAAFGDNIRGLVFYAPFFIFALVYFFTGLRARQRSAPADADFRLM